MIIITYNRDFMCATRNGNVFVTIVARIYYDSLAYRLAILEPEDLGDNEKHNLIHVTK